MVSTQNGAKGKALAERADWDSDEYADARDLRSAAESSFTLKQAFEVGWGSRRGLAQAYAELLESARIHALSDGTPAAGRRRKGAAREKPTSAA